MKTISSIELSQLNLPCLPKSKQGIEYQARKGNWAFVQQDGIGRGGRVKKFIVNSLPQEIRDAIHAKHAAELLVESEELAAKLPTRTNPKGKKLQHRNHTQVGLPFEEVKGLNDKQKECALARMAIVADVLNIARTLEIPQKKAIAYFLEQLECGTLPDALVQVVPIANARHDGKSKKIGMRSLAGWVAAYRAASDANARLAALAPKLTKTELPLQSYMWLGDFMGFHCRPQAQPLTQSYEAFADWWCKNKAVNDLPSIHQVRRVWHKLPVVMQERGRKTGAAYKSLLPYVDRDWDVLEPNDVWIGDGHSFKAKIAHPKHGAPYVPEVTVVIDGCTRKIMGFSVSLAENKKAVSDALRIGMKTHGVPLIYYSDNGAGQTAKTIDHPIMGLCARLGICHMTGLPGNPQGRGIIEGLWDNTLIRQARTYPTFTGTGMDKSTQHKIERKMASAFNALKKGKELTDEQKHYRDLLPRFEQFFADLVATVNAYNARPHSSLPKKGNVHYSPDEYYDYRLARLPEDKRPMMLAAEEMELLYRPQEDRVVDRGWIRFLNKNYFSTDLLLHQGETVYVAYDWDDPKDVIVYDTDGRYICKALLNGNTRPAVDVKSVTEQMAETRTKNQLKRLENQAQRIKADLGGGLIEHIPDFGKMVIPDAANEAELIPAQTQQDDEQKWDVFGLVYS